MVGLIKIWPLSKFRDYNTELCLWSSNDALWTCCPFSSGVKCSSLKNLMYFPFHFELLSSLCLDAQRFFTFSLTPSRFAWVSFRAVPLQFTPRVRAVCFPWAALLRVWSAARFSPGSHSTRVLDLLCLSVASSIIDTSFHLFWFFFSFQTLPVFFSKHFYFFTYFWLRGVLVTVCGLSSRCGEWVFLFAAACGLLVALASLVVEHGLQGTRA